MFKIPDGWRAIAKQEKLAASKIRPEIEGPGLINRVEHTSCRSLIEDCLKLFSTHIQLFPAGFRHGEALDILFALQVFLEVL